MLDSVAKISPLQIVRRLKSENTATRWKLHPELCKYFWKEFENFLEWSDGYFCCSIGNASIETVRKCIESQGKLKSGDSSPQLKTEGFSRHNFIKPIAGNKNYKR